MPQIKPERVFSFRVEHPQHASQLVSLINPKANDIFALATQEAARRWGAQWGKVVGECKVNPFEQGWQCICGICKNKFVSVNVASECPACIEKRRRATLQYLKRHPTDRRINAGR